MGGTPAWPRFSTAPDQRCYLAGSSRPKPLVIPLTIGYHCRLAGGAHPFIPGGPPNVRASTIRCGRLTPTHSESTGTLPAYTSGAVPAHLTQPRGQCHPVGLLYQCPSQRVSRMLGGGFRQHYLGLLAPLSPSLEASMLDTLHPFSGAQLNPGLLSPTTKKGVPAVHP